MTFAVIIAHLFSYQKYCRSSGHLLALFIGWSAFYSMGALSVLKKTQEAFHDSVEAVDGIRQSLPAFPIYMLLFIALQYITFITTDSEAEREREPEVLQTPPQSTLPPTPTPLPDTTEKEGSFKRPTVAAVTTSTVTAIPDAPPADIPDAPPPPPPAAPTMAKTVSVPQVTSRKAKASAPPPPPPVDPRSALLGDISAGKAHLRPVKAQGSRAPVAAAGLEKWLADARKVLQPDGEASGGRGGEMGNERQGRRVIEAMAARGRGCAAVPRLEELLHERSACRKPCI